MSKLFNSSLKELVNCLYPIGSIYISTNSTNPSILFSGTWEQIKDTFLLACGDNYSNGATGGEANHVLTIDEMPSHAHKVTTGTSGGAYERILGGTASYRTQLDTTGDNGNTGGNQAHNNMPPYLAVYMWKRTA